MFNTINRILKEFFVQLNRMVTLYVQLLNKQNNRNRISLKNRFSGKSSLNTKECDACGSRIGIIKRHCPECGAFQIGSNSLRLSKN